MERVSCGGTSFDCVVDYIEKESKEKFDGLVMITDGEAQKPKSCKCQRMWVMPEENLNHPYFSTNELVVSIR